MDSSSLRRVGGEAFWVGLGQAVAALGGIVGVRLLTGFMTPAAYGELALALTFMMLAQQLIFGPLGQAFMRFFAPMQEANKLPAFFRAALVLLTQASGTLLLLTVMPVLGLWAIGEVRWVGVVGAAFLMALVYGWSGELDAVQNAARQRIVVAWHDGAGQWARFAVAVFLIVILGSSSPVAVLGYTLGGALVLASQLLFLKKLLLDRVPQTADRKESEDCMRQMRQFGWPFASWGLFTWAQLASDRWALQAFAATGVVGLYAALFQVGYTPILLVTGLAVQLFSPILFSWAGDASDPGRLKRAYRLNQLLLAATLALTAVGTMLAFVLHNQIFRLVVAPQYRQVAGWLPYMVLAGGLFASGQIASLIFLITGETRRLLAPKIGTSALCVLMNIGGAYRFGLAGVVFANVTFSLAYLLWVSFLARRQSSARLALGSEIAPWIPSPTRASAT
ncbi:MAG: oligosaccharide flippase family protein [Terriglobia bacterium]